MVMPYQEIKKMIRGASPIIFTDPKDPITDDQIQPASLDFRLGSMVHRVRASSLPGQYQPVIDMISAPTAKKYVFNLDKTRNNLLEKDHIYVAQLMENCALPKSMRIEFSPKSSAGRADLLVRVLCDRHRHFDYTPWGYHGPLWAEITPLSFDVEVREAVSLLQGRIKTANTTQLNSEQLERLHAEQGIICDANGKVLPSGSLVIEDDELILHVELNRPIVGFRAHSAVTMPLNMLTGEKRLDPLHRPKDFWTPIERPENGKLTLLPGHFYLLMTQERTRIPPTVCAQMIAAKSTMGEYRVHYAGFFDPGFNAPGVLEVRAQTVPIEISDGSPICAMKFEKLFEVPEKLYGSGNHYAASKPSLAKYFQDREAAWESPYWGRP